MNRDIIKTGHLSAKYRYKYKKRKWCPIPSPRRDRAAAGGANHSRGLPFFERPITCGRVLLFSYYR